MQTSTQILVIGGGPGGSTAATLLAREGFEVTLLEKAVFPREHIGESLIPSCLPVLDLTGAREKIDAYGFVRKHGAFFSWGPEEWDLTFGELTGQHLYSFQVVRAEFDQLLLEHAKSQGVKVFEGVEVTKINFDGQQPKSANWTGNGTAGQLSFDYLIDASGRAGLLANHYLKNRQHNDAFQNIALWGYWKDAKRLEKGPEGAIIVGSVPHGWLWGIPLHNGTLSVGLIIHKTMFKQKREQAEDLKQVYLDSIQESSLFADLLDQAQLVSEVKTEQDYSYAATSFAGPGYFMIGDAACFLDPLLSTGIHLASFSALVTSACIASILRGEIEEAVAQGFYDQIYRQAYTRLLIVVSNMYQQYKGKKSYFWEAQKLTTQDYQNADIQQAFLNIVSGIEDVNDLENLVLEKVADIYKENKELLQNKERLQSLSEEERQQVIQRGMAYNSLVTKFLNAPEDHIRGLSVRLKPQLGIVQKQSVNKE